MRYTLQLSKEDFMSKAKIVTICGSMRFKAEQKIIAEKLELENRWVVIQCIYGDENRNYKSYTSNEIEILSKLHKAKIDISDAIFVVNIGGYIGESTTNEINYATKTGKEVIYLEQK